MEDPWGSPWDADDSQLKLDLPAPPPRIHTPQTPQKTTSPWAPDDEEDVWGGWNAPDGGAGAESPGWGRSPARSPARSPGMRPARSGTVSRHISPEPWGRIEIPETQAGVPGKHVNDRQESLAVDSAISLSEQPFAVDLHQEPTKDQPDSVRVTSETLRPATLEAAPVPLKIDVSEHETESDDPGSPDIEPSRAVTSSERPGPARQASKVQELVDMYDGIARRKDSPTEPLVTGPRITLVGGDAANDDAKDAAKPTPVAPDLTTTKAMVNIETGLKDTHDENETQDTAIPSQELIDEKGGERNKSLDEKRQEHDHIQGINNMPSTYTKAPSIPYSFDLAHLDELFPAASEPAAEPEPVPDVIIDDTFASISERKAWYRISRFGPMRQHNLGNDEDYVRLDWRVSEVRSRTLRTVRRWMEEDSITGRTVLGRRIGPGGASMFNWNSQAPQVEIGELLGKRGHGRSFSGTSKGSKMSLASPSSATFAWSADVQATDGTSNAPRNEHRIAPPLGIPSPTVASFGWSTSPREGVGTERGRSGTPSANSSRKVPPPLAGPPTGNLESMDTIVANGARPEPSWDAGANGSEDEDDWGEMVSSPTWPSEITAQEASGPLSVPDPVPEDPKDKTVVQPALLGHDKGVDAVRETSWTSFSASSAFADAWNADNMDTPTSALEPETPRPWSTSQNDRSQSPAVGTPDMSVLPTLEKPGSSQLKAMPPTQSFSMSPEDEMAVASILNGVPDLSYMLR